MDRSDHLPLFPATRCLYSNVGIYYAYGNTPVEDLLENAPDGIKDPAVLMLGCGDMRSCFYTLWKHFNSNSNESEKQFDNISFVLNDCNGAVLARNVLFLYLCLHMPVAEEAIKKWLSAIWAIWYCHELFPEHKRVLDTALKDLIQYSEASESWSSPAANPLCSLVQFASLHTLCEVHKIWKMWYNDNRTVTQMHADRKLAQLKHEFSADQQINTSIDISIGKVMITADLMQYMVREITEYFETGNAFAETVLGTKCTTEMSSINPTFYERVDGTYTMEVLAVPYRCFHHAVLLSPKCLWRCDIKESTIKQLIVNDKAFDAHPILANSIQQFALWLSMCATILSQNCLGSNLACPNVVFTFHCSDAIRFCQELQSPPHAAQLKTTERYDLIYTSNLADHVDILNLVLFALPLLKANGLLFTSVLCKNRVVHQHFRIENKLLPLILGVRWINYEGKGIASKFPAEPAVPLKTEPKVFMWENLTFQPFKISSLEKVPIITSALLQSVELCVQNIPNPLTHTAGIMYPVCTETAIKILQIFASHFDADISDYQFWLPLCSMLKEKECVGPFLHSLQTQALLHSLHLHITVSKHTCPLCMKRPITKYLAQVCVDIDNQVAHQHAETYMVFVHDSDPSCENPLSLHLSTISGQNAHIIDCIASHIVKQGTLSLVFYVPLNLVRSGLSFSVVCYGAMIHILKYGKLHHYASSKVTHSFTNMQPCVPPNCDQSDSLGTISSHYGNGDQFNTEVLLSEGTLQAIQQTNTKVSCLNVTQSEIKLSCGRYSMNIHYPHPVKRTKLSIVDCKLLIFAKRRAHCFQNERTLFLANPDNSLAFLPNLNIPSDVIDTFNKLHVVRSKNECEYIINNIRVPEILIPHINTNDVIGILLEKQFCSFFEIGEPVVRCLLVVNNRLFDLQRKTPAVDVAFFFLSSDLYMTQWNKIKQVLNVHCLELEMCDDECKVLKQVFMHFARRTISSGKNTSESLHILAAFNIVQYFTRALVYPRYFDPDLDPHPELTYELEAHRFKSEFCSFCNKPSCHLKKCTHCYSVQYCGEDCQKNHWLVHKMECRQTGRNKPKRKVSNDKVCSYCETVSTEVKRCARCNKVQYCGADCQQKHWPTHKADCHQSIETKSLLEEVQCCSYCSRVSTVTDLKSCTRCHKARYCGKDCQRSHWSEHKRVCLEHKNTTVDSLCAQQEHVESAPLLKVDANQTKPTECIITESCSVSPIEKPCVSDKPLLKPFPVSQYTYSDTQRWYYAYGNTPAEDFLENIVDTSRPIVLLLGCGDLRSIFYTLWRTFTNRSKCRFENVKFVLNDYSAAILARDILFLYLCVKMPRKKLEKTKWICAMWAIWFCHELLPDHVLVLYSALNSLLQYSEMKDGWCGVENPLCSLVQFTSSHTLNQVCQVWRMWLTKNYVKSVDDMHTARKRVGSDHFPASESVSTFLGVLHEFSSVSMKEKMEAEIEAYFDYGNAFAESILDESFSPSETSVNVTLYEQNDGSYTLHYESLPFRCFHHTFQYSSSKARAADVPRGAIEEMIVKESKFDTHPLLANCIQQFGLWLSTSSSVLTNGKCPVSFNLHCSDAIQICLELQSPEHKATLHTETMFDLIHSSNLVDHLTPTNLVLCTLPLLKSRGRLFTTTLCSLDISKIVDEYVQACFGFDIKLLPIIVGVHCKNHEGKEYANQLSVQSIPFERGNYTGVPYFCKHIIWEKVSMHPLIIPSLDHASVITSALYQFIQILSQPKSNRVLKQVGSETAARLLITFAKNVCGNVAGYEFWTPLCSRLQYDESLEKLLVSLQTHCFLHNVHIHLTVSENTCPLCRNVPITEFLSEFSVQVQLPLKQREPNFVVYAVPPASIQSSYLQQNSAHTIDCVAGVVKNGKLHLHFYFPVNLAQEYMFEIYSYVPYWSPFLMKSYGRTVMLNHGKLKHQKLTEFTYNFDAVKVCLFTRKSLFGTLTAHNYSRNDQFESIISLSDTVISTYLRTKSLVPEQISPSEIKLSCGEYSYTICYPTPIKYEKLSVKVSRKNRTVSIRVPRCVYIFHKERPLFLVEPDNNFAFPNSHFTPRIADMVFCGMQFTNQESRVLTQYRLNKDPTLMTAMVSVKETFKYFFNFREEYFFEFKPSPSSPTYALVLVNSRVFDVQRRTPAVDLAFCFKADLVCKQWITLRPESVLSINVCSVEEDELLQNILLYFAKRTIGTVADCMIGKFQLLKEAKIDQYFTRALVYPLYPDPDLHIIDKVLSRQMEREREAPECLQS